MNKAIKQVFALFRNTMRRFGLDIVRYPLASQLDVLRQQNLSIHRSQVLVAQRITAVLDGGANVGQYATDVRTHGYAGKIVSFEPLPAVFQRLQERAATDPNWQCFPFALGEQGTTLPLHVSQNVESNSFLPLSTLSTELFPETAYVDTQIVDVRRLDDLAALCLSTTDSIMLKLDVQGYELHALRGATETLNRARLVEVEINLAAFYEGQALPGDIFAFLHHAGFDPIALEAGGVDPATGHMLWVDGLFARRDALDADAEKTA